MEQIRIYLFIVVCMISGAAGTLTVLPQNRVVMRGQETTMMCQTDKSGVKLRWDREIPASGREVEKIVFNGDIISPYVDHFCTLISDSVGEFNIRINAVEEAARRYTCLEPATLQNGSAELIVLHNNPVCTDNSNNDYINATCTILFRGNWPPEMTWTLNGEDVLDNFVTKVLRLRESLTTRLVLQRNLTGYSISCKTNFTHRLTPSITTAKNVPTYISIWQNSKTALSTDDPKIKTIAAVAISCPLAFLLLSAIGVLVYQCYKKRTRQPNRDNDLKMAEVNGLSSGRPTETNVENPA